MSSALVLELVSRQARALGDRASVVVEKTPFRVGRGSMNDWDITSEPTVSRDQLRITGYEGHFFIEARGVPPVLVNGVEVARGERASIQIGDEISFDEYEIRVRQAPLVAADGHAEREVGPDRGESIAQSEGSTGENLKDWLAQPPVQGETHEKRESGRLASDHVLDVPNPLSDPRPQIPEDFLISVPDGSGAKSAGPDIPHSGVDAAVDPYAVFLRAAGFDEKARGDVRPEDLGTSLRAVIDGVLALERARAGLKQVIRVSRTEMHSARRNPLKSSKTPDEALHKLYCGSDTDALRGRDAFDDAFADLEAHEIAMVKAMREAFKHVLQAFDPARIEQVVRRSGGSPIAALSAKTRSWDQFVSMYERWSSDEDDAIQRLYVEPFAKAYEAEERKEKAMRARKKKGAT